MLHVVLIRAKENDIITHIYIIEILYNKIRLLYHKILKIRVYLNILKIIY